MNVTSAEQDLAGRNAHHLALGMGLREDLARLVVVALVEWRHDDPHVGRVVVDARRGEAVAGATRLGAFDPIHPIRLLGGGRHRHRLLGGGRHRPRRGQQDDLEGPPPRLRYSQPDAPRPYRVPGGLPGIWLVAGMGLAGSMFGLVVGFVPPSGLDHWPTPAYVAAMAAAIMICSLPAFVIDRVKKPGWRIAEPDAILLDRDGEPVGAAALKTPGGGS